MNKYKLFYKPSIENSSYNKHFYGIKTAAFALLFALIASLLLSCGSHSGGGEDTTEPPVTSPLVFVTGEAKEIEPEAITEQSDPQSFSLRFTAAGDNIIHTSVMSDAHAYATANSMEASYSFSQMLENISARVSSADIAFVSQESVIAGSAYGYSGYPSYNSPNVLGYDLTAVGFNVINLATNHMLDMGRDGLDDCVSFMNGMGEAVILSGLDDVPYKICTYYSGDESVDIAYLCYTFEAGEGEDDGLPILTETAIMRDIPAAEEAADFTIVSVHWGEETEFIANESQEKWASTLCALGADVIIGTHPYMLQKIEYLYTQNGNSALCAYSLGNLLSGMLYPRMLLGGLLSFDINVEINGDGTKSVSTSNVYFEPTFCHYDENDSNFTVIMLTEYSDTLAAVHGAQKRETFDLAAIKGWLRESVSTAILPEEFK